MRVGFIGLGTMGAHAAAIGEAMVAAKVAGLEPEVWWEAMKGRAADSYVMHHDVPAVFAGHYAPSSTIDRKAFCRYWIASLDEQTLRGVQAWLPRGKGVRAMQQPPGGAATGEKPDLNEVARIRADHARWLESDGAEGVRADLSGMELADVRFPGADLRRAVFVGANLFRSDFAGAELSEADFTGANLNRADLAGATLQRAVLDKADLSDAALGDARMEHASLVETSLQRAWLGRAHLEHATLIRADLHGAWVGRANLEQANLEGAMLVGAEFPGTSFRNATLRSAYFGGVALVDADLSGADLGEVRNLTHTQLESATVDERTILPPELIPGREARAAG